MFIRTVLCCAVMCTTGYEQFLKLSVGLGLVFVSFFWGVLPFVCLSVSSFDYLVIVLFCSCRVRFSFFSTTGTPRDWLGRTSPK